MATSIDPSAILGQLVDSFVKLPLIQKILFPVLVVASVGGIIMVSKWASRPDYAVLFSDLDPADSAAVVERLKAQKINYQIRGDGNTIAISPPEMVHELRLSLSSEGVPRGGSVGLEIFDTTSFGTTSFVEKLKFVRALQGELERTIASLDVVETARVHIAQPEKTVFAKKSSQPTASVVLKLRAGGELSKQQVKGITNLIAGSVEGLRPENVNIVDVLGNLLTVTEKSEDELGVEATRIQYQREVERGYVERVEGMLAKVLGQGKVIARVTADLDYSSNEREEESFDPGGQVVRSERSITEGIGTTQRGGIPGVVSNITDDQKMLAAPGTGDAESSRSENLRNYEVSRAVSKSSLPRGRLIRLSVAVLVDGTYETAPSDTPGKEGEKIYQPLGQDTLAQIEGLVKGAVGFDNSRGDTLTVENIPFFEPDKTFEDVLAQKASQDLIFQVISKAVPIVFVIFFFLMIVKPLVKFLTTPTEAEVDLHRLLPTGLEELETELETERARAQIPAYEPSIDLAQLEDLLAENKRIVKENPQQAALLIRYWLNDGRL